MKLEPLKLYRDMLLNTWATFIYFFSQWLLTILITRLNGYDDAGIFALAISFCNIFGFLSKFGMRGIQVGDVQENFSHSQYFTSRIITTFLSIAVFAVALLFIGYESELRDCCIAMISFKALEGFDDVITGAFQKTFRYKQIAISYTLKSCLTFLAMFACLMLDMALSNGIWAMSIAYAAVILFYDNRYLQDLSFVKWSVKGLNGLYKQCIPLLAVSIMDALLIYMPRNAIDRICGAEELGYYGSISILVTVLSTLAGALGGIILNRYSQIILAKDWKAFGKLTVGVCTVLLAFGAAAIVFGLLLGPWFFSLLYGKEILSHMYLLMPVLLNAVLLLYNSFFSCICIPINKRNVLMISNIIAIGICFLLVNHFTARYGSLGACLCFTVSQTARFIFLAYATTYYSKKHIKAA